MAISLSDVQNALQKVILPYVRDNFPKQTILLDQIKRNVGTQFMNNNFYVPLRSSRHSGVVNLASDTGKLVNGKSGITHSYNGVKTATGTFEISKLAIEATKTEQGSVEPMLNFQSESLLTDFSRSVNRQFMGDENGVLATLNPGTAGTAAGSAVAVKSVSAVNGDISAVEYLSEGMVVKAGTQVGTISSVVDGGTVGTVNFTASVSYGTANPDVVLVDGDLNQADEFMGLDGYIATAGTFQNLARATTPQWSGQVGTLAGGTLTLKGMEDKHLLASKYAMTGDRYAIFANRTPYARYGDILVAYRRDVNTRELIGGWKGLGFQVGQGEVGVFLDYQTPDGKMIGTDLDSITIGEVGEMGWEEDPNSGSLLRRVDYITYQAVMVYFAQFLGLGPAANWKLESLSA